MLAGKTLQSLGKLLGGATSREAAKAALPGAGLNLAIGTLTGGPVAGAAYAAGDFLLNYPVVAAARKYFPGTEVAVRNLKTGKVSQSYQPSNVEQGLNLAASLASMPLVDIATQGALLPQAQVTATPQSQEQQLYHQLVQRQALNELETEALAPGTMYQMQGIEQTAFHYPGLTLPPSALSAMQGAL
jgi:hypothetical protein